MIDLPVVESGQNQTPTGNRPRTKTPLLIAASIGMHTLRVAIVVGIVACIQFNFQLKRQAAQNSNVTPTLEQVRKIFPDATIVKPSEIEERWLVMNAAGDKSGSLIQTSPGSDHIIGFSGPTNMLIGLDDRNRIIGVTVAFSGDTREHLQQVIDDKSFLKLWKGLSWQEAGSRTDIDGVTGATLTSLAIAESIIHRLGGNPPSLKFPEPVSLNLARELFPKAQTVRPNDSIEGIWFVVGDSKQELGLILRTTPAADNHVGYQGPTESLIGLDNNGQVIGLRIGKSFDNEPYVTYVRDEAYFLELFSGKTIDDLANMDLVEEQVEGVSGATMTSMSVAESLIISAKHYLNQRNELENKADQKPTRQPIRIRDWGTIGVVIFCLIIGFKKLRRYKTLRVVLQLILIIYVGFINGDLISQSMLVGWSKSGVPVWSAFGLFFVTAVAFAVPIFSKTNVYCSHICPHGAAQQLLRNRLPWKLRLSRMTTRLLSAIPALLLLWVVLVGMTGWNFSLVDIEPFDAYVFSIAGWPTIIIAVVGLVASLFIPMGYCRFGCPTGALLDFLRFNAKSHKLHVADIVVTLLLLLALGILLFNPLAS